METEQYEEAVRDYEKIVKMDKSRGKSFAMSVFTKLTLHCKSMLSVICSMAVCLQR